MDQPYAVPKDEAARVRLGAGAATKADVLIDLSNDTSVTVRAALALNTAAPPRVNEVLAADSDERVRILLARKLTALVPGLSAAEHARLHQETWDTLKALVADEAVRVRAIIAEAVKELPDAPRGLIRQLAHDTEKSVFEPVIRLSPLLTTEDLLTLVAMAPAAGTVLAVAHRAELDPVVSDAIAASADGTAIRALLANPSAQICEATLDVLVARSVNHPDWHEPLVRRPSLPPRAAHMLSELLATHLLAELATRADLPPSLAEELRRRIAVRLAPVTGAADGAVGHNGGGRPRTGTRDSGAWRVGRGNLAGGGASGRDALCGGTLGPGRRYVGFGGGSRIVVAQRQGAGQPRLEGGIHHAGRCSAADLAGAAGT